MARNAVLEPTTGRSRRWVLLVGAVAIAGSSAFATWWSTTLSGLPDIGDPFDVAAFAEKPIPDDENAYVLYRQAVGLLSKEPSEMTYDWANAGPVEKGWLERNREPLEIWRRGTERPRSLYIPSLSMTIMTQLPVVQDLRAFGRLTQLDGGRLEAEGDLEGAWRGYRAIFRSSRHVAHHSTAIERMVGMALHQVAARRLTLWASDPRVTAPMLRRALDAAISDYSATGPISDNLKVEYLAFLKTYEDPDLVRKSLNDADTAGPANSPWFARDAKVFSLAKGFNREPERTRRVSRLIYANLLAYCDLPPDQRPPVACSLPNFSSIGGPATLVDLFTTDPSAPASARALKPDAILRWYRTTLYATRLTPALSTIITVVERERVAQANLVIALANRLYEVERGKPPETAEDLVGPYLKALPDGYKPVH